MSPADGSEFAAQVADPRRHAVADFSTESDRLLILFGGIAGGVSMPVYEFFRVTGGYPVKRLFLRDPRRAWYLRGLPGVGNDAVSLRDALRQTIVASGASRVVMAGSSAGGFASILFGSWLGVDAVVAFSPQTSIGCSLRAAIGDQRWPDQIAPLHQELGGEHPHYDVLPHIANPVPGTAFHLHVSRNDALDLVHARRLDGLPGVKLHEHRDGGHRLVRTLRDRGELQPILMEALGLGERG